METTFGAYLRGLREMRRLTLRKFCLASGVDPSNFCKIENGTAPPPQDSERLRAYLGALNLSQDSAEGKELARLASISRGEIPASVRDNAQLMGQMPVLFRTIEEGRLTADDVARVVKAIKEG